MDHLFTAAPATLNAATATSLVFLVFGMLAVASSLQQIYEKVFGQGHHGGLAGPVAPADLDRGAGWCGGGGKPGRTARTYGTIGAIFGIMTWFIAIGAVIILGAVAGATWEGRRNRHVPGTITRP